MPAKERFGVAAILSKNNSINLSGLDYKKINFSWYFDYCYENSPVGTKKYFPLIGAYSKSGSRKIPDIDVLNNLIKKNRSKYPDNTIWFIGNEVGFDDGLSPAEYAKHYNYYYKCLKKINPTYKIAFGAVPAQYSYVWDFITGSKKPLWQGYPTDYIIDCHKAYSEIFNKKMPVDFYRLNPLAPSIHYDIDNMPHNISFFKNRIIKFRRMMKSIGEQNKPLIIAEFGVLKDSSHKEVIEYMYKALDFLTSKKDKKLGCPNDGYRLVQMWSWYSLIGGGEWNKNGALFDSNLKITPLGMAYAKYIDNLNDDCSKKEKLSYLDIIKRYFK